MSQSKRKSDVLKPVLKQEVAQINKRPLPVPPSPKNESKQKRRRESKVRFDDYVYGSETGEDTESDLAKKTSKRKFSTVSDDDNDSLSENKPLSRKKSKISESLENSFSKKVTTASNNHRSPKSKDNSFVNNNNNYKSTASGNEIVKKPRGRPKKSQTQEGSNAHLKTLSLDIRNKINDVNTLGIYDNQIKKTFRRGFLSI